MRRTVLVLAAGACGAWACTVDWSRPIDTAQVPTAAALGCEEGEVVQWRGGAWDCATLAGGGTDTLAGLECADGQTAKWLEGEGRWECGDDLMTDPGTDSLAAVGRCEEGEVLEWQGSGWTCGQAVATLGAEVATARGGQASLDARLAAMEAQAAAQTAAMEARMAALEGRVVVLEEALCPAGFTYAPDGEYDVCERTFWGVTDEMVKVGGFWIDRYEISQCPDGQSLGGGSGGDENGGETTTAAACSVAAATPQADITWFQAAQMCANAGKRLCTNAEWQAAASGTPDAGADTTGEECNVSFDVAVATGSQTDCVSRFGAFDMAGNLWEWVADWHGKDSSTNGLTSDATYGSDYMYDVSPARYQGAAGQNFPAAALRGGHWAPGTSAGAFALGLNYAPSYWGTGLGARCCAGVR